MPSNDQLAEIALLVREYEIVWNQLIEADALVEQLEQRITFITTKLLPAAMELANTDGFSSAGKKVKLQDIYSANISAARQSAAHAWMREHNKDGLIKTTVSLDFGKGQEAEATAARELLAANNIAYETKEGVHPQTLKAFVKEQVEAEAEGGTPIPRDLFGIYIVPTARVESATPLPKRKPKK